MAGIGIVTNPYSKLNKRNPDRARLLSYILGEKGILETTQSLADLQRVAHEFHKRQIEILAINGGDGTISRTLTAFIHAYKDDPLPKIALLRGGTMNVVANNLRIKGSPESLLYRLLEVHSRSEAVAVTKLRTLNVQDNYGFLFGTGIVTTFLNTYYKKKSNALGAALLFLKFYLSYFFNRALFLEHIKPHKVTLSWDSSMRSQNSLAVFCSTVERMPLGLRLFPLVKKNLQAMQCVSFAMTPQELVWTLPLTLLKNGEGSIFGKQSWRASSLQLETEKPLEFTIDGEIWTSDSVETQVKLGPTLDFIRL